MMEKSKEVKWINCAKFVAVLAVITDHTYGVLYTNYNIALASYFSVSLFIIISGMMCFLSNERHELGWFQTFVRSSKNIIVAYLLANFIYLIRINKSFDLRIYLQYVIGFNLSLPFYYVLLYLQLMLVSRLLYNIIKRIPEKHSILWEMGIGSVVLVISFLTTNYTNILNVYGGGGKLLGGTYLFLFYLGMLFSKHDVFRNITLKKSVVLTGTSLVLWIVWWIFVCYDNYAIDAKLSLGTGLNPPGITLGVMGIIVLFLSSGLFSLFQHTKYLNWITNFCSGGVNTHYTYSCITDFSLITFFLADTF